MFYKLGGSCSGYWTDWGLSVRCVPVWALTGAGRSVVHTLEKRVLLLSLKLSSSYMGEAEEAGY